MHMIAKLLRSILGCAGLNNVIFSASIAITSLTSLSLPVNAIGSNTFQEPLDSSYLLASRNIEMSLAPAFEQLRFSHPVLFRSVPQYSSTSESNYNIVLEKGGKIKIFENRQDVKEAHLYIDLSKKIFSQGESGLLGIAFDPNYSDNHYVYIHYNTPALKGVDCQMHCTVVSRFKQSSETKLNPKTEKVILSIPQTSPYHSGGDIAFGPDGYLYVGVGDDASDDRTPSQNRTNLMGAMLRIAIDEETGYSIPEDNPFYTEITENEGPGKGKEIKKEIWAYGLRNPYRFSFDEKTGLLWLGDIGKDRFEEIDIIVKGGNYGWPIFEGPASFDPHHPAFARLKRDYIKPISSYGRKDGQSITAGFVYRGEYYKKLTGKYIYADYGSGRIWALPANSSTTASLLQVGRSIEIAKGEPGITAIGQNVDKEIFIVNMLEGRLMKLSGEATQTASLPAPSAL